MKPRTKPQDALLKQVATQVFEDLSKYQMTQWHTDCGTEHCIAGWALTLAPGVKKLDQHDSMYKGQLYDNDSLGELLLGEEAASHFRDADLDGLIFLQGVLK